MNAATPPPTTWTVGTTEVFKTGTWRAALPVYLAGASPCHLACPVGGEIARWMQQAKAGDWHGAWTTLVEHNPFPAVAGRVCHHPCETACNRAAHDTALSICKLERFAGDAALVNGWRFPETRIVHDAQIAIVGGGPSGLAAAYHLRRLGYPVTVFEAKPRLGGLLREGIPPYRLPRAVLDGEIARLLELGIEARRGVSISTVDDLKRLRDEYAAVYLAIGAARQKHLPQLDYGHRRILDASTYLAQANAGQPPALGEHVVVIGGGSAAMDVARSAARAGHDVTVVSLERDAQMPAQREEVLEARQEGVIFFDGAQVRSVHRRLNGAFVLECVHVDFRLGPTAGRFEVTPLPGSEFVMSADGIVSAIGQDPELAALSPLLDTDGALVRTDRFGATSLEGVFAGGDVASNARFVTQAFGMGESAAQQIHRWLRSAVTAPVEAQPAVPASAINTYYYPHAERVPDKRLGVRERLEGYAEVQLGLAQPAAEAEAARCFSCGNCTFCDNCFVHCPDMAVKKAAGGYRIAEEYCKGCGLCVRECPTGAVAMREELR